MSSTTLPRSRLTPRLAGHCRGHGSPLLLIHGVGMQADFWSVLLPRLEQQFSLTVIDLPGHGDSPRLNMSNPTLADYSDTLAELLAASTERCIVIGHSMGALIALDLAVRHTRYVAGVGVLNGVYRRSADAQEAIGKRVAELSTPNTIDDAATLRRWFGETPTGADAHAAAACRRWLASKDRAGYLDAYRVFATSDAPSDEALRGIAIPALVMTGSAEPNSTPAMASGMSRLICDAHCVIIDGARHMMPLTHRDAVNKAIIEQFGIGTATHG